MNSSKLKKKLAAATLNSLNWITKKFKSSRTINRFLIALKLIIGNEK